MAAEQQLEGFSPQMPDDWPNNDMSQLQHGPISNSVSTTIPLSDQASDDLAYKPNARGNSFNNPPPNGWLYPHKKGIGTGSNLEPFKAEIEARTQRGENCKAIAAALNDMGVQTSDRAVSRVRIRWGMRKRAQRKVKTPQPDVESVRLSAKSKMQAMRKAELIRMTREGMSPEEIYQSLTTRGMELKKGVATVLRLQSAWGVARDEKRWLGNFRHQCHKKAKAEQAAAFTDIANELGVQDTKAWVQAKMKEQTARQARHELALKLMGEHAPTNPERRKLQKPRRENGPAAKRAQGHDVDGESNSVSSEDEQGSGSDFPAPVTNDLKFGLIDSARQSDYIPGGDGQIPLPLPNDGHGGAQSARSPTTAPDDPYPAADLCVEAGQYHGYPPLHHQPDGTMHTYEQGQHSVASIASHVSSHMDDSMPQAASGPDMPMAQHPTPSNQMLAPALSHPIPSMLQQSNGTRSRPRMATATSTAMLSNSGEKDQEQVVANSAPVSEYTAPVLSGLVLPPEEAEANKSTLSTLDLYNDAARVYKELLEARNNNKPLPGSLTGMPPSAREVDSAKRKLKEATQAMMLALD